MSIQQKIRIWIVLVFFLIVLMACQNGTEELPNVENQAQNAGEPVVTEPGKSYQQMILLDETVIEYALVLPDSYTLGQSYPILLALPPGDQTEAMVEAGMWYWEAEAFDRGWIVVSPIAPNFTLFFQGSETYLPEFLNRIGAQYPPEGGKFHVAGVSNGGISSFRAAINNPELVQSVVVLPGYPLDGYDRDNLVNLQDIPVAMFVGENDEGWVSRMQTAEQSLSDLGVTVTLDIRPGEGHVIRSLTGEELFDLLDSFR